MPSSSAAAAVEICEYLKDSFGNATRIDYGTGHEMAFVMLLCALFKLEAFKEEDQADVGLVVFAKYAFKNLIRIDDFLKSRLFMRASNKERKIYSHMKYFVFLSSCVLVHSLLESEVKA